MKICSICKQPNKKFNKNARRKDGLQTICQDCSQKRSKRYYQDNKEHHRKIVTKRNRMIKAKNQKLLCEYLSSHPCVDCEERNIVVLDFDHLRDKCFNISTMIDGHSWEKILDEIAKCEVVCANCHRIRTATRTGSYRLAFR
jgi:hypothetical protein